MKFCELIFILVIVSILFVSKEAIARSPKRFYRGSIGGKQKWQVCTNDDQCGLDMYCHWTCGPKGRCRNYCTTADDCQPTEFCNFDSKCSSLSNTEEYFKNF